MVSSTVEDNIEQQIVKKIFKSKIEARPVNAGLYMAFKHSFATYLLAMDSESCQTSFPSFCSPPSEVAVLLDWNLSKLPFLRQVVD